MNETTLDRRWRVALILLSFATVVVTAVALNPNWRIPIQAFLSPDHRVLLATVNGDLAGTGEMYKVLKYATHRGLIVEVMQATHDPNDPYRFVDRVVIPDRHDGFFSMNSEATRLALLDVDGDGHPEIIAPSFDESLSAHLNTLKFDPETKRLSLMQAPAGGLPALTPPPVETPPSGK